MFYLSIKVLIIKGIKGTQGIWSL